MSTGRMGPLKVIRDRGQDRHDPVPALRKLCRQMDEGPLGAPWPVRLEREGDREWPIMSHGAFGHV